MLGTQSRGNMRSACRRLTEELKGLFTFCVSIEALDCLDYGITVAEKLKTGAELS